MVFKGTLTDETLTLFKTNTPHGGSPESTVKFCTPGGGLPYNKVKVYASIGSLKRDKV